MLRINLTTLIIILSIQFSSADTEFADDIPVDLAKALISPEDVNTSIYADIMASFPAFQLPSSFGVVGSVEWVRNRRVVLQTELAEEEALESILSAFTREGWKILPSPFGNSNQAGVLNPDIDVPRYSEICHDEHGVVVVHYSRRSNWNLVALNLSSYQQQLSCDEQISNRSRVAMALPQSGIGSDMRIHMPRIELPGPQNRAGMFSNGYTVNGFNAETKRTIENDWTIAQTYEHVAAQLRDQGWELDAQTIGNISAVGNWIRNPEPNLRLIGMLTIIEADNSNHELRLMVMFPEDFGGN